MSSNQVSNYQPIIQNVQNVNKEIVTVTPIFKIEPDVLTHKNIKSEYDFRLLMSHRFMPYASISPFDQTSDSNSSNIVSRDMQDSCQSNELKQVVSSQKRSRGHIDRYNGMSEDEVMQRKLPDYLREGLDLIVVTDI